MAVLGGGAVSYERGIPVGVDLGDFTQFSGLLHGLQRALDRIVEDQNNDFRFLAGMGERFARNFPWVQIFFFGRLRFLHQEPPS